MSVARLRGMHGKEGDPEAGRRLPACIRREEGRTITGIAAAMNGPRSTATDRLGGTRAGGPGGMHYTKNRGACKLDGRQLVSLARDPDAGPAAAGPGAGARTMPPAREHIKKFGAEYHIHSVWDLAGRRGFAHARPLPRGARGRPRRRPGSPRKSSQGRRGLRRTRARGRAP